MRKNVYFKKTVVFAMVLLLIICLFTGCAAQGTATIKAAPTEESNKLLQEASLLVNDFKYKDAISKLEDNYNTIQNDDRALEYYAFLEGYFFRDYGKAEKLIGRAVELNPTVINHYAIQGLIYENQRKYNEAIKAYKKTLKLLNTEQQSTWDLEASYSYLALADCYMKLKNEKEALENYENAIRYNPCNLEANAALHRLYVKREEYGKAYQVWKTDNCVDDEGNNPLLQLVKWNDMYKAALSKKDIKPSHKTMAELYSSMVLYDEAKLEYEKALKEDRSNADIKNKISELDAYITFRDQLQGELNEYYRKRCIDGAAEEAFFYKNLEPSYSVIAKLFPEYARKTGSTQPWVKRLNREIEKKFNVRIQEIVANGTSLGMHFGRIIDVSEVHPELFGRKADLRIITLRNMVSNGVDYWRSAKNSGVGGWSISRTEIVRVIGDRDSACIISFTELYDKDKRAQALMRAAEHDVGLNMIEKAPLDLYYSSTLAKELDIRQMELEIDKLKNKNMSAEEIYKHLFSNYENKIFIKSNIHLHESQHSIDKLSGAGNSWLGENEYRPKLAQLAYSDLSFLVLNSLYTINIDSDIKDTHIQANKAVIEKFVQYIYDNPSKYPKIDTNKNILSQITKLDESDIREIAAEIYYKDYPLAREEASVQ